MTERVCKKCGVKRPLTLEYYAKSKYDSYGFQKKCRHCVTKRNKELRKERKSKERECRECGEYLHINMFKGNSRLCNDCKKKKKKELTYRIKRKKQAEKELEDFLKEAGYNDFYKKRAASIMSRGRSSGKIIYHTEEELTEYLEEIWKKQDGRCALTGIKLSRGCADVDHINPVSKDGKYELSNVRWVYPMANRAKFDRKDAEFYRFITKAYNYHKKGILPKGSPLYDY